MTDINLETKVIRKFVLKEKQERYLTFIQKDKTRYKFLNDLYHPTFFRVDLFKQISGQHESDEIKEVIQQLNVSDCYIISTNRDIDGKRMDTDRALKEALSDWADRGTLLIFGDAEIVYREHEGPKDRWISRLVY
jgi:hypothetical protein